MKQDREQEERIAGAIKQFAVAIDARMAAPDAGRVWRKAEAYRKELALRRAMRSLLVMRGLGGLYAVAMLVWCFKRYLSTADGKAVLAMDGAIVLALGVVMVATTAGAWFLVREGRRETLSF